MPSFCKDLIFKQFYFITSVKYPQQWLVVSGLKIPVLTGKMHQTNFFGSSDEVSLLILKLILLKCHSPKFRSPVQIGCLNSLRASHPSQVTLKGFPSHFKPVSEREGGDGWLCTSACLFPFLQSQAFVQPMSKPCQFFPCICHRHCLLSRPAPRSLIPHLFQHLAVWEVKAECKNPHCSLCTSPTRVHLTKSLIRPSPRGCTAPWRFPYPLPQDRPCQCSAFSSATGLCLIPGRS